MSALQTEHIVQILESMNTAAHTVTMYPPTSIKIADAMSAAMDEWMRHLSVHGKIAFVFDDAGFSVNQTTIDAKWLQQPAVASFFNVCHQMNIESLVINKEITLAELRSVLSLLYGPDQETVHGSLETSFRRFEIVNVVVTEKPADETGPIPVPAESMKLSGENIIRHLLGEQLDPGFKIARARRLAKDPSWLKILIDRGVAHFWKLGQSKPPEQTIFLFKELFRIIEAIADAQARDPLPALIAQSIVDIHNEKAGDALLKASTAVFGKQFADTIASALTAQRLQDEGTPLVLQPQPAEASVRDRYRAALGTLLKGDLHPLSDPNIYKILPSTVDALIIKGHQPTAQMLLKSLSEALQLADPASQEKSAAALAAIAEQLLLSGRSDQLIAHAEAWLEWMEKATEGRPVHAQIAHQLMSLTVKMVAQNRLAECVSILQRIRDLAVPSQKTNPSLSAVIDPVMRKFIDQGFADALMTHFISRTPQQNQTAAKCFMALKPYCIAALADLLRKTTRQEVVNRIRHLLIEFGPVAADRIRPLIRLDAPWHRLRSLPTVLAATGMPTDTPLLKQLLAHDDVRVQREAIHAIYQLNGPSSLPHLLESVQMLAAPLQVDVIRILEKIGDDQAMAAIQELMVASLNDTTRKAAATAHNMLISIRTTKEAAANQAPSQTAIDAAPLPTATESTPDLKDKMADPTAAGLPEKEETSISHHMEKAYQYMQQSGAADALSYLSQQALAACNLRQFALAEQLRDGMYQIDPSALGDIAAIESIIETEKKKKRYPDHFQIFAQLSEHLTTKEANTFFDGLLRVHLAPNQMIVQQGEYVDSLYFLCNGKINILFQQNEQENFIQHLVQGAVVGTESFFRCSASTTSAFSVEPTDTFALASQTFNEWTTRMPNLAAKLRNWCLQQDRSSQMALEKGMERRFHPRHIVAGAATIRMLSRSGRPSTHAFSAHLVDISAGGASFLMCSSNEASARMLLGRDLHIVINLDNNSGEPSTVERNATVHAVGHPQETQYVLHVAFHQLMDMAGRF